MRSILFGCFLNIIVLQQSNVQSIDSTLIAFKAKLLTTSRLGVTDSLTMLRSIQGQQLEYLYSPIPDVILMKVKFDQKYFTVRDGYIELIGTCYYYLAFNVANNKFYRLGGFEALDIEEFFSEVQSIEEALIDTNHYSGTDVDFYCLLEYSQLSKKKKARRGSDCFQSCNEEISEYLVSP